MDAQRFRLEVNVRVQQLAQDAGGQWYSPGGYGGLEVRDSMDLTAGGFLEIAGILYRFHELVDKLRAERQDEG